jgi:hypothetical protein
VSSNGYYVNYSMGMNKAALLDGLGAS